MLKHLDKMILLLSGVDWLPENLACNAALVTHDEHTK